MHSEATTIAQMIATTVKLVLRAPRKLKCAFVNILAERGVENVRFSKALVLPNQMKNRRLRNTAVKNEQIIPMIRVVAKPLIGPVPNHNRIKPVIIDVRLESKMAEKALL